MASVLGLFDKNISYFTVPLALLLPLWARYISALSGPGKKLFDEQNPRSFAETVKNSDLNEAARARILRAEGCSSNGFEALPIFATAVTAGNSAGIDARIMNTLTIAWVFSRVWYTYVYIWYQETEKLAPGQAPLRTKVWTIGAMICMSLFVMAGLKA